MNQNIMSVVRFYSGPVKFTLGWLDRIDKMFRRHLTQQGLLMKRGMATSRLYMSPEDMGMGLKSSVGVYLLELVRILLQTSGEPSSGVSGSGGWRNWPNEMEKGSGRERNWNDPQAIWRLHWVVDGEDHDAGGRNWDDKKNGWIEAREREQMIRAKQMKSIDEVLEEVGLLIDTHFFNEFA